MYYKLAFKYFIFSLLSISFLAFALIWIVDPLQVFHKSFIKPNHYMTYQMREANLGILNYADFDSVILGTSMVANMSSNEVSQKIGGNFINMSMFGSSFYERKLVLDKLLNTRKVNKIIGSIDGYFQDPRDNPNQKGGFPLKNFDFLYNDNYLDNFKIYFNSKYISYLLAPFVNLGKNYKFTDNLDRPKAWCFEARYVKRFGGFQNWLKNPDTNMKSILNRIKNGYLCSLKKNNKVAVKTDLDKNIEYLNEVFLDIVKKYPDIEFHMVIPPYSLLSNALNLQSDKKSIDNNREIMKYLVQRAQELSNLKIYGFDNESFKSDIANYKDLEHYHQDINSYMVDCIANKSNILTSKNIDDYYARMKNAALNYDIKPFYDAIVKSKRN